MNREETLKILNRVGAVVTGSNIVYTSGLHGSVYVNKDALFPHDTETSLLCDEIAWQFRDDGVEVVVAPAIGGVILSRRISHRLTKLTGRWVPGVYAEREEVLIRRVEADIIDTATTSDGKPITLRRGDEIVVKKSRFVLKRGYGKLVAGKKALVVEDVLTTGGSAKKVVEATRAFGGEVIGVGVLCNRGGVTPKDLADVPKLFALVNLTLDAYDEADCPLCRDGVPMNTEVGKGKDWLARNAHKFCVCPKCGGLARCDEKDPDAWSCLKCGCGGPLRL